MATEYSNHYKSQLKKGLIDEVNDSIKIILMATGFVFDKDAHATYADVSASELATGNGYTQNTKTLTTLAVSEDDTNDRSDTSCDDVVWTAAGGSIGPSPGAILFDDTTADDTVIGYIDFGADKTADDGAPFKITSVILRAA